MKSSHACPGHGVRPGLFLKATLLISTVTKATLPELTLYGAIKLEVHESSLNSFPLLSFSLCSVSFASGEDMRLCRPIGYYSTADLHLYTVYGVTK